MKKILLLLVLSIPLPACEDQCGSDVPRFFDVQNIQWQAERVSTSGLSGPVLRDGETVGRASLRLKFAVVVQYYSLQKATAGQAFACSPAPAGYQGTSERVDSLVVLSRYDYDAAHPAGRSLNDLLDLNEALSLQDVQITPRNIARPDGQPVQEIALRLKQAPTASAKQQFFVRYRQTNGEVYSAETPVFTIVP
ncbi:hypothetical protein [Hymenobacter terrestris]|uniref:DUF5034 domain-containing protein n=1 Tax=Hymenobacter terrestris TaxID=2748310 RepID=A0ABX2Q540_9BACT|nr:hypothetical protein [Hymenobacter terrestris]NVO86074.1 hypothetical protein [Hymenobacter terrestris]